MANHDERRHENADLTLDHLLVGYDGSAAARDALHAARRIADRVGSSVTVGVVREIPTMISLTPSAAVDVDRALDDWIVQVRTELTAELEGLAHWDLDVRDGHAATELEAIAADRGVDLIIVGSRGHGPVYNAFVGSVANHLVNHAPVPVLVIR